MGCVGVVLGCCSFGSCGFGFGVLAVAGVVRVVGVGVVGVVAVVVIVLCCCCHYSVLSLVILPRVSFV